MFKKFCFTGCGRNIGLRSYHQQVKAYCKRNLTRRHLQNINMALAKRKHGTYEA